MYTLEDLPANTAALLFIGPAAGVASPVNAGLACLGPGAVRVGPVFAIFAGTAHVDAWTPSLPVLVGHTYIAQAVYRDVHLGGVNLTNALRFQF